MQSLLSPHWESEGAMHRVGDVQQRSVLSWEIKVSEYVMSWHTQSGQNATWQTAITYCLTERNAYACLISKLSHVPYITHVKQSYDCHKQTKMTLCVCSNRQLNRQKTTQCVYVLMYKIPGEEKIHSSYFLFPRSFSICKYLF